jgi:hypothetical protein
LLASLVPGARFVPIESRRAAAVRRCATLGIPADSDGVHEGGLASAAMARVPTPLVGRRQRAMRGTRQTREVLGTFWSAHLTGRPKAKEDDQCRST